MFADYNSAPRRRNKRQSTRKPPRDVGGRPDGDKQRSAKRRATSRRDAVAEKENARTFRLGAHVGTFRPGSVYRPAPAPTVSAETLARRRTAIPIREARPEREPQPEWTPMDTDEPSPAFFEGDMRALMRELDRQRYDKPTVSVTSADSLAAQLLPVDQPDLLAHVYRAAAEVQTDRERRAAEQELEREAKEAAAANGDLDDLDDRAQGYLPYPALLEHKDKVADHVLDAALARWDHGVRCSYIERGHARDMELVEPVYPLSAARFQRKATLPSGVALLQATRDATFAPQVRTVVERDVHAFRTKLDVFTRGALRPLGDLRELGLVVGGSAVLACLAPLPAPVHEALSRSPPRAFAKAVGRLRGALPARAFALVWDFVGPAPAAPEVGAWFNHEAHPFARADVDLFVVAPTLREASRRAHEAVERLTAGLGAYDFHLVRTSTAVTVVRPHPERTVQVVTMAYRSVGEVLAFADIDATAFAYDGRNVFTTPRGVRAVTTGCCVMSLQRMYTASSVARVVKYARRGFATSVSNLPEERFGDAEAGGGASDVADEVDRLRSDVGRAETTGSYDDVSALIGSRRCCSVGDIAQRLEQARRRDRAAGALWFVHGGAVPDVMAPDGSCACPEVAPMRWKVDYVLQSRHGDLYMPRCYMCQSRFAPTAGGGGAGLSVCAACTSINRRWAGATADLRGRVALVTGGRIKIGFQVAAKLLRCGATVIVVTRFPRDAAKRLRPVVGGGRAHVYGVDLRQLPVVTAFLEHVRRFYGHVDIVVNNAAQTVRRPAAYYRALFEAECEMARRGEGNDLVRVIGEDPSSASVQSSASALAVAAAVAGVQPAPAAAIMGAELAGTRDGCASLSAACTQLQVLPEDREVRNDALFPPGKTDLHGEQLDLRPRTSWTAGVEEVDVREALEVQVVNATVPLLIASSLLPSMLAASRERPQFIINVSSPEGQFSSHKTGQHAHTNVAKAGLNMLTRTLAHQCAHTDVSVTSVDTGWVSRMRPGPLRSWATPPPLTEEDGAARVLQPVFASSVSGQSGERLTDCFLQHFEKVEW